MSVRRVALVTGGAKRVGAAVARRLSAAGFVIIISYKLSRDAALDVAASIGGEAIEADLAAEGAGRSLAGAVLERHGRCDVLFNNASLFKPDRDCDNAVIEHARVNVDAPLALIDALAPALTRARGHVVNMLDVLAERPMRGYSGYSASKAALATITLAKARQLAPAVTVNGIAPGVVAWPDDLPIDQREAYLAKVPLGRAGTPEDVAALAAFLVTEGTYITGQVIRLDGGRSLV
ncbi:MAG TPA: SDR family oxidoreductase [Tepidisphaeraceae bacterium]